MSSSVAGLQIPPATGIPFSTMAIETQNSGMPCTNSRVPSSGSTTHTRCLSSRVKSSTVSSESQPSPGRRRVLRRMSSTARSASVTGSCPTLYSASIAPGVKRLSTARGASSAAGMRSGISCELEEDIRTPFLLSCRDAACRVSRWRTAICAERDGASPVSAGEKSRPEHARSRHQQNRAQDSPQPQYGNARAQMRAEHSAGDRADQQRADQMPVDVPRAVVQQASDAGQNHGVGNVGAHHDLGSERIKQKQQHHDDAARPDRSDADQKSADESDHSHEGERLHGGLALGEMFFNPSLEQKQRGNQYQQQSHGGLNEVVHAGAVDLPQVHQKRHAEVRSRNAADGHRQYDLLPHCALPQVHDAGGNLREKVEQRITTDGNDSGNMQAEDEHGQQQHAAAQTRQPDQRSNREADQHF